MPIGYLIPEFPSQTHVWMWREIALLRKWGAPLTIFSTRRPPADIRAKHAFAHAAESETIYLWPASIGKSARAVLWAMARHPVGFLKAARLGLTLPVNKRPAFKTVLPLLVPACALARECARRDITRLHSQTCSNSAVLCMMVKRVLGLPFSLVLNAPLDWWGGAMAEKLGDAEFTVTHAQWLLDEIRKTFTWLKPAQSMLARVGVDTVRWSPDGRAKVAGNAGAMSLMTVGRLHASKGHDVLLRAVRLLVDRGRDVTLRLAGAGSEREALEKLSADLGLTGRVRFLGSLSEDRIIDELRTADVFVLASHAEPLGIVYMEAMALGLPAVGTSAGGVGEIIDSGSTGVLVPPKDPEALATALDDLMADDQRRRRLGDAGREKVVRQFDSSIGAEKLYERFMGKRPALEESPATDLTAPPQERTSGLQPLANG